MKKPPPSAAVFAKILHAERVIFPPETYSPPPDESEYADAEFLEIVLASRERVESDTKIPPPTSGAVFSYIMHELIITTA